MLYHSDNLHGGDIYKDKIRLDFSVNLNPYGIPDYVRRAITDAVDDVQNYPDPYCRELVSAISAFEELPASYILCGNGAAELIYSYCSALYDLACNDRISGDQNSFRAGSRQTSVRALETAPTFSEYSLALSRFPNEIFRYRLKAENGFALEEGFLKYAEEILPDVIFLCNPNNPTGRLTDQQLLFRIVRLCSEKNIRLFLDECFLDLADDNSGSLKYLLHDHKNIFILKAFTKNFALSGVRLGYCLCSDASLLAKMSESVQPWNVSVLAQAAGTAALKNGISDGQRMISEHIEKARKIIPSQRSWLTDQLTRLGLQCCPSEANYILLQGPQDMAVRLKKDGIAIRDCSNFHGLEAGWFRIAVKLHEENEELIKAFSSTLKKK